MCFSMLASAAVGTTLVAAGAWTVALARGRMERPLALLPLLFGVQQLVEAVVWWSLDHDNARLNAGSTVAYTLFSHVLWPVFVPFAILCMETAPRRRRVLAGFLSLGALVSLYGLATVLSGPSTSSVAGSSIRYAMPSLVVIALYLLATCVGAMFSSHTMLKIIGAAALALALLCLWLYLSVFVSVWCFFSAVLTLMIFGSFWSRARAAADAAPGLAAPSRPAARRS